MYEHNGEKYFIVDGHTHFWDASPANWVKGQEQYAKGWIECFHAYMGLGPPETHWPLEKFMKYSEDDYVKDVFEDGGVDARDLPVHVPEGVVHGRLQHGGANARLAEKHPGKLIVNGRWDPREGEAGLEAARGGRQALQPQGRQGLHGRVVQRLARLDARATRRKPFFEKRKELGIKNVHAHKGPTIWPLDKDAFDVKDVDVAATEQSRAQLHRRARGPAEDRGLLLHGDAGAERLRRPRRRARRPDARPPAVLREGDGRAAVLGRRGQDAVRQRLRDLGAEVADRGLPRLGLPRPRSTRTTRALDDATKRKILGLNAAKLYGIEVPAEFQLPNGRHAGARRRTRSWSSLHDRPERIWGRWTRSTTPSSTSRSPRCGFVSSCDVSPDGDVEVASGCRRRSARPISHS